MEEGEPDTMKGAMTPALEGVAVLNTKHSDTKCTSANRNDT